MRSGIGSRRRRPPFSGLVFCGSESRWVWLKFHVDVSCVPGMLRCTRGVGSGIRDIRVAAFVLTAALVL